MNEIITQETAQEIMRALGRIEGAQQATQKLIDDRFTGQGKTLQDHEDRISDMEKTRSYNAGQIAMISSAGSSVLTLAFAWVLHKLGLDRYFG